jgi:hypothetical protein
MTQSRPIKAPGIDSPDRSLTTTPRLSPRLSPVQDGVSGSSVEFAARKRPAPNHNEPHRRGNQPVRIRQVSEGNNNREGPTFKIGISNDLFRKKFLNIKEHF